MIMTTLLAEVAEMPKDRCNVCGEEHSEKELQHRRQTIAPDRMAFQCSVCDGNYLSKEELWDHQKMYVVAVRGESPSYEEFKSRCNLYKCLVCTDQRVYENNDYWKHLHETHNGCNEGLGKIRTIKGSSVDPNSTAVKHECSVCDHVLTDRNLFSQHMEVSHGMIVCSICTVAFSDSHEFQVHKFSGQSASMRSTACSDVYWSNNGGNSEEANLTDSHHNVNLKMEISVEETALQVQEHQYDTHQQEDFMKVHGTMNSKDLLKQGFNVKEEPLEDDTHITPMESEDSSLFEEVPNKLSTDHQKNWGKVKACPICGLKFPSDNRMRYHKLITHTDPHYRCPKCPKVFHAKHMLTRHETTHLLDEVVRCSLCFETYSNKMRLQRHLNRSHSVPCELCELRFTTSTTLDRHKRKNHKDRFPIDSRSRVKLPGACQKPPLWNQNQLQEAITDVVTQRSCISQASAEYNVPKGTLYDNILGKVNRMAVLQELVLSADEEDAIINFACPKPDKTHKKRAKRSLSSILDFMGQFEAFQAKAERFKFGGIPGYRWWWAFCRKHSIDSPRSQYDGRRRAKFDGQ